MNGRFLTSMLWGSVMTLLMLCAGASLYLFYIALQWSFTGRAIAAIGPIACSGALCCAVFVIGRNVNDLIDR